MNLSDDNASINSLQLKLGELERKLNFVLQHLNLTYQDAALSPAETEAINWLRKGNKIEAIKAFQHGTGVGLKEAKERVEALEKKLSGA